jgi:GDSL-like Lipase/Acylhydrolase family
MGLQWRWAAAASSLLVAAALLALLVGVGKSADVVVAPFAGDWSTFGGNGHLHLQVEDAAQGPGSMQTSWSNNIKCGSPTVYYSGGYHIGGANHDDGSVAGCTDSGGRRLMAWYQSNSGTPGGSDNRHGTFSVGVAADDMGLAGTYDEFSDGSSGSYNGTFTGDFPSSGRTAAELTVTYTMPDRVYVDAKDHMLHYPTTPEKIDPSEWPVDFTVQGCDPQASYQWLVGGNATDATPKGACSFELQFPHLGQYSVEVHATPSGGGPRRVGTLDVTVKDYLVVGIGDSMASGESAPDKPISVVPGDPAPGDPPDNVTPNPDGVVWQDQQCHRSGYSYQAQTALALERAEPTTSVTFVHLGCSGANIPHLVNKPYKGVEPGSDLAPQIAAVKALIGGRKIDAVVLSAGINDLNFGQIASFCWKYHNCPERRWEGFVGSKKGNTLKHLVPKWLRELRGRYRALAGALKTLGVPANRVYIGQYPDPLHDGPRTPEDICQTSTHGGLLGISKTDAAWLYKNLLIPLNTAVKNAARRAHWTFVSGAQRAFRYHGYCAQNSWTTTYQQSYTRQDNDAGTLHPNYKGHKALAQLFVEPLKRALRVR